MSKILWNIVNSIVGWACFAVIIFTSWNWLAVPAFPAVLSALSWIQALALAGVISLPLIPLIVGLSVITALFAIELDVDTDSMPWVIIPTWIGVTIGCVVYAYVFSIFLFGF